MRQPQGTALSAFFQRERQTPDHIFLRQSRGDTVRSWTYQQAADEVRRMATALHGLKLPPGSKVAILAENCPEWILADLAIVLAGYVTVPIATNLEKTQIKQILDHAEVKALFIGSSTEVSGDTVKGLHCICFASRPNSLSWSECITANEPLQAVSLPSAEATATIQYTPSLLGATFSGAALAFAGEQVSAGLRLRTPQRVFCALPLASASGRLFGELLTIASGSTLCFPQAEETLIEALQREQPGVFVADADAFASLKEHILASRSEKYLKGMTRLPLANIFLKAKLRRKLGFQHASSILCADGPAPVGLLKWFAFLDFDVRDSFGTVETCGYSHANFRLVRYDTVGQPWPWVEVKIDSSGELLIRHPAVMQGYLKNDRETAQMLTAEGFVRTGQRGKADPQGFLVVDKRPAAEPFDQPALADAIDSTGR